MTVAFLNGRFFGGPDDPPLTHAAIPAFDAGLQHGVGLFETMLGGAAARGLEAGAAHGEELEGWVLHLDEHMERLARSARELGLSDQLRTAALGEAVLETVKRSRLARARVRLTITGGDLSLLGTPGTAAPPGGNGAGAAQARAPDPTVLIVAQRATEYPAAMFDRGVRCVLAGARANPLDPCAGHKTLNYWWRLRELQAAARKGAGEAIVLSVTNHVCSGCVSNVLLVSGEELITPIAHGEEAGPARSAEVSGVEVPAASNKPGAPALASPVLPGVVRAWAIDKMERWGLSVRSRMVSVQDLLDADEVMLTNSSWGVLPVVGLEGSSVGGGEQEGPGRYTRDLRDAWLDLLPRNASES